MSRRKDKEGGATPALRDRGLQCSGSYKHREKEIGGQRWADSAGTTVGRAGKALKAVQSPSGEMVALQRGWRLGLG